MPGPYAYYTSWNSSAMKQLANHSGEQQVLKTNDNDDDNQYLILNFNWTNPSEMNQ